MIFSCATPIVRSSQKNLKLKNAKQTATATKEQGKIGRPYKTRTEKGKEDLNITAIKSRPDMTRNHRQ